MGLKHFGRAGEILFRHFLWLKLDEKAYEKLTVGFRKISTEILPFTYLSLISEDSVPFLS